MSNHFITRIIHRLFRLYWRVFKPITRGARALVILEKGKVLLVKHTYSDLWYLPGGGVHRKESPEEALHRELREELGIETLYNLRLLGNYENNREFKRDTVTVFSANAEYNGNIQASEIKAATSFDFKALPTDISPATKRRIEEFLGNKATSDKW